MSTYRATVRIEDGMLHTARPLTAPEHVADLIDSLVYSLQDPERSGGVLAAELSVETAEESTTPIGDSVTGSSSSPVLTAADDDDDVNDDAQPVDVPALTLPSGQA
jgi:hypothetical protein